MATYRYTGAKGTRSKSSGSRSSNAPRNVSVARLHQKSGSGNAFGGYARVNHYNGTFSMRKSGK